MFRNKFVGASTTIISLWLGFTLFATYSVFVNNNIQIYAENGILENIQASILAISCILFLLIALFKHNPEKLILLTCFMLCYGFVLRELDVEDFDIPYILKYLGHGAGRNTTVLLGFVAIFLYAVLNNFVLYKKTAKEFLQAKSGALMILAGVVLFIGAIFEKQHDLLHNVYFEEILELSAFVLILLSAFSSIDFISKKTLRSSESNKT